MIEVDPDGVKSDMRESKLSQTENTEAEAKSAGERTDRPGRRLLLDLGPLLLFFGTNYATGDFMLSVKVLVGTTVLALAFGWLTERRISMMAAVGCVAVAFFGGLSVYFDNELFIKIKPTILTILLAVIIAGGRMMGRNPLRAIMGGQIDLTDIGWQKISWLWVTMFVVTAIANEIAWRTLSTDGWVTFKAFGITAISLAFMVVSFPVLTKHQIEK